MSSTPAASEPGPFDATRFYSVAEAADALTIRPKSVRAAIRRRDLIAYTFAGTRGFRLHGADLNAWVDACRQLPPTPTPEAATPAAAELLDLTPQRPQRRRSVPSADDRLPTTPNRSAA
jgi:excisionase family DNA binding protein